ncbi:MAG: penicillin-binding protein 2 [Elusimicrobiota bacterium]|jgi:penicillin-binding protein 2|nr:penicillin-binding protein 2 [Elusimicrobiota bacterium]
MVWKAGISSNYGIFFEKQRMIFVLFAFMFGALSLRLFELQIIKGSKYRIISQQQRIHTATDKAPRGIIYSSDGQTIVNNEIGFALLFYPFGKNYSPTENTLSNLSKILNREIKVPRDKLLKKGVVVRLADNLSLTEAFKIQEYKIDLEGIVVKEEPYRNYCSPLATAHFTGYISEVNEKELKKQTTAENSYKMGDYIGRGGIEQIYDKYLKGEEGYWEYEVNVRGYQTQVFQYIAPKIGNNIYTTVDLKLQEVAFDALKNSSSGQGAAVVIDVKTGAVKAIVSCPSFDTNDSNGKEFIKYMEDLRKPLFNRTLQAQYSPGSIFKIITFSAALECLSADVKEPIVCNGSFELGNRKYACWYKGGHGRIGLISAMNNSCNVYFYQLGLKVGINNIEEYSRKFFLGEATGVDLPNEKKGFVPSRKWKKEKTKVPWLQGDTVILAIGQGGLLVTPLQMAQMMVVVANKGVSFKPYVVEKIVDRNNKEVFKHTIEPNKQVIMLENTWMLLHKALFETVNSGTAHRAQVRGIKIAGKTGTAQNPLGEDHAWFVSYAPIDNPEIAVAVIVENGGGGGSNACPIAKQIYEKYFENR